MKKYAKKIVIIFFIISIIFSTIDISVFQTLASEGEKITKQSSQEAETVEGGGLQTSSVGNKESENKEKESEKEKVKENIDKEENKEEVTKEEKVQNLGKEEKQEEEVEQKEEVKSEETEVGDDKEDNNNPEKILLNSNGETEAIPTENSNSKQIAEIDNTENDFTYYYEGNEGQKTNCNSKELNNVIKEDKGNLIIELNKDISIEPSYDGSNMQAALIFPKSLHQYTLKLNSHIIRAEESDYNIIYATDTNITIENGTITGANSRDGISNANRDRSGGGLFSKNCNIIINNINFVSNTALKGGAIYCEGNGSLTINGSTFIGNDVKFSSGGGICVSSDKYSLKIENTDFKNNNAGSGAGLYVEAGKTADVVDITMENCTFSENNSATGGMGIDISNHFSLKAKNVKVINNGNINQTNKGALVLYQGGNFGYESKAEFDNLEVSGNLNKGGNQTNRAAGLTVEGCSFDITLNNTTIKNNKGRYVGGLSVNGQTQNSKKIKFTMNSGVIFGNSSTEANDDGIFQNDVYVAGNADVKIPSINEMAKIDNSLVDYYWNYYRCLDGRDKHYEFQPSLGKDTAINLSNTTNTNIYNVSEFGTRNVAEVNEIKYTTLKDAFDNVQNNGTIKLIAGEKDDTGKRILESVTFDANKNITIDLNGREWADGKKYGTNIKDKAFIITNGVGGNGPNVTIKDETGSGSISNIALLGGNLTISSKIKVDGITLGVGKQINASEGFGFTNNVTITVDSEDMQKVLNGNDVTIINSNGVNLEDAMSKISIKDLSSDIVKKLDNNGNIVLSKLRGVYIGNNGNDTNSGDDKDHPVKTFEKALNLAKEKQVNTIYVVKAIEVSGNEEWNVPEDTNVTLCRYNSSVGNLVEVKENGELTLINVDMDGLKDTINSNYALIRVDEKGTLNIKNGTVLKNNNNSAVDCRGTINMTGGEISGNSASVGAGVHLSYLGTMTLDGDAVIKENKATEGGGGIAITEYSSLTMNGGTISNNKAEIGGGGISVGDLSTPHGNLFTMNGGIIKENSTNSDGGGILVQSTCKATINKGEIIDNKCGAFQGEYGGGGIYVNGPRGSYSSGMLRIPTTAYISENKSSHDGAGIAGCSTSKVVIYDGGASVFNNNLENGKVADDVSQIYVNKAESYGSSEKRSEASISKYAIGGVQNHWTDENGTSLSKDDLKLTNDVDSEGNIEDIGKILKVRNDNANVTALARTKLKAKVLITGNQSSQKGGGIGTNGEVYIGDEDEEFEVSVDVTKTWDDNNNSEGIRPNSITVNLYANGIFLRSQEITEADGWKYKFTELPKYDDYGHLINYTISEVKVEGYETSIKGTEIINTHHEETSINVTKTWNDENDKFGKRPDKITVNLYANGEFLKSQEITETDGWKYTFDKLPKYDDNNQLINYTISEVKVEGYETTINGTDIVNTYHEEKKPPEEKVKVKNPPSVIKPPKTGGILENQSVEQKGITLPFVSQILPIMLVAATMVNYLKLIKGKNIKKKK